MPFIWAGCPIGLAHAFKTGKGQAKGPESTVHAEGCPEADTGEWETVTA